MIGRNQVRAQSQAVKPLFAARLHPHRSLNRGGFVVMMVLATATCLVSGTAFALAGAWPVSGFFGLDIAALALAFFLNYRSARAFEEVALWRHDLLVRKHSPAGRIREHRFNPFWTRLRVDRHEAVGVTRLALTARGREITIGDFLNPPDRKSFAEAFAAALWRARGN